MFEQLGQYTQVLRSEERPTRRERYERVSRGEAGPLRGYGAQARVPVAEEDAILAPVVGAIQQLEALSAQGMKRMGDAKVSILIGATWCI